MVKIVLSNFESNSPHKNAIIDILAKTCLINNKEIISISELKKIEFIHPLLNEVPLVSNTNTYTYPYANQEELFLAPRFVYATLIQIENPFECKFEIHPDYDINQLKMIYEIPFSFNPRKTARETININQLNQIASAFYGYEFHFNDNLLLKTKFSLKDLPSKIDSGLFYKSENKVIHEMLHTPDNFEKLEIRFINHIIGFGVFCRKKINKGELIALYLGAKKNNSHAYFFEPKIDSFNLGIDSMEYGNIGRFINHAHPASKDFLGPNLHSKIYNVHGIEVIGFSALRDINPGEQLLYDYSDNYFMNIIPHRFKANGALFNAHNQELRDNLDQKLAMVKLCAQNGVKSAIYRLVFRFIIILIPILVFFMFLSKTYS